MGQDASREPSSPQELYQWCLNYHSRGRTRNLRLLLEQTSEKILGGGLLALQIVGRIDSTYQGDAIEEPSDAEASFDDAGGVRFEVPTSTGGNTKARPLSARAQTVRERAQFEVPTTIRYLSLLVGRCPHMECKLAFLVLARTVSNIIPQTKAQRQDNQKAIAGITHFVIEGALALRDIKIEELVQISDVIRLYAKIPAFRDRFLQGEAPKNLLEKVSSTRGTAENLTIVCVFGALRAVLTYDANSVDMVREAIVRFQPDTHLVMSLETFHVESTALIEQMSLTTLLIQYHADFALSLNGVAAYAEHYLSGKHGWNINDSAVLCLAQALCFLIELNKEDVVAKLDPVTLIRTCRRVIVRFGLHESVLIYISIVLEHALKAVMHKVILRYEALEDVDGADESVPDDVILLCMDTCASLLTRVVAVVTTDTDLLSSTLGKVCILIQLFSHVRRHKAILLNHACTHLLVHHVISGPDFPDWILVPAIETVSSLLGSEQMATEMAPVVGERALRFDVNKIVPLLCRLLAAAKHDILPRLTVAIAVFRALDALVDAEGNARFLFKSMSVAEMWVWRSLKVHFVKQEEQQESLRRVKLTMEPDKAAVLQAGREYSMKAAMRLMCVQAEWETRVERMLAANNLALPQGHKWVVNQTPKTEAALEGYTTECSRIAGVVHEKISLHPDIGDHFEKYTDRAQKLQKWYKKKFAVVQLNKTTREYQRHTHAATLIQSLWRGLQARREHRETIKGELLRSNAAVKVQRHWRAHVKNWVKNRDMMVSFICQKMGVAFKQSPPGSRNGKLPKLRRSVVQLKEWNYYNTVQPQAESDRHYSLVLFYSQCTPPNIFPIFERIAILFKECTNLILGIVEGNECPKLTAGLKIPGYEFFFDPFGHHTPKMNSYIVNMELIPPR